LPNKQFYTSLPKTKLTFQVVHSTLDAELPKQRELDGEYNKLRQRLDALRTEAENAHQNENSESKQAEIEEIQQKIQPLLIEVASVQQKFEPPLMLTADPQENLSVLKNNIEDLKRILDSDQKNAVKQLQLAKIGDIIRQQFEQFMDGLRSAEQLLKDPNASVEELQKSRQLLDDAQPQLDSISKIYNDLDPEDEATQELRNKTADQLSKLNELFKNNQQSAQDRIDLIYEDHQRELAELLNEAQNVLVNEKATPEEFDEYSARLLSSIEDAQKLAQPLQSTSDQPPNPQLDKLNRLLEMATETRTAIDEKADLWRKFRKLCNEVGNRQDTVQQNYDNVRSEGLRPASDLQKSLSALEVSFPKCSNKNLVI
jgi:DNA repair exonuclease SbcCD ATPase subunit